MTIDFKAHKIFAFSDTHGMYRRLTIPADTDILICAGDACEGFNPAGLQDFFEWYGAIPAKLRIFGHVHEEGLQRKAMLGSTTFLNVSYFEELRKLL